MSEAFGTAVEVLREIAETRESELRLTAAEAAAVLETLAALFVAAKNGPDSELEDDYFKSYGEVVHELTEANKQIAAMRESWHQSLHPQTTNGDSCRYCEQDWPL